MKNFFIHARRYIFRGLIAIAPILLCVFALRLLYVLIDKNVIGFLNNFVQVSHIPGLGILLVLITLYLIGLTVGNIVGRQFFSFIEEISQRIPFIKTIYGAGKQLSHGFSSSDEKSYIFKKAILIKLSKDGLWLPAFVVNTIKHEETGEDMYFAVLPTAPTPLSGFVVLVKASETLDPGWTVEECLKTIISMGIIPPKEIKNV